MRYECDLYSALAVYPCAYKEHKSCKRICVLNVGLSLCIQGTLVGVKSAKRTWRFIPVYTGNIPLIWTVLVTYPVYPCVYREHGFGFIVSHFKLRFIPVYTGNMCKFFRVVAAIRGLSLCIQGTYQL